jgi:integrase
MAYKRCWEKGCKQTCKDPAHTWWVAAAYTPPGEKQLRFRGPVDDPQIAHLLDGGFPPTTKTGAEEFEATKVKPWVKAGMKPPVTVATTSTALTVATVIDRYVARMGQTKDKSKASILKYLKLDFGKEPLTALLDPERLEDYMNDIVEEGGTNGTANRYLAHVSILLNYAIGRSGFDWQFNPARLPFFHRTRNQQGVKKFDEAPRNRRIIPEEEAILLSSIDKLDQGGEQMRGRFLCALQCGPRRGEMLLVKRDDIKRNHRDRQGIVHPMVIHFRGTNTKSGKERYVPVEGQELRDFLDARRFAPYPFGAEDGSYQDSFRKQWMNALAIGGITDEEKELDGDLHWHDIRHEFGNRYIEKGGDIHDLKELMGHSSITTTERYLAAKLGNAAAGLARMVGGQ